MFLKFTLTFTLVYFFGFHIVAIQQKRAISRNFSKDVVLVETSSTESEFIISNSTQEDIVMKIDHTKAISQKLLINDKIYAQYYNKNKDYIKIKKESIGNLICKVDVGNIVENLEPFAPVDENYAKKNKFYKASVYEYLDGNSNVIIKIKNKYYLFTLVK